MSAMSNPTYGTKDDEINSVNVGSNNGDDEETPFLQSSTSSYRQKTTCYVYMLSFFAAIGGFLFGYDTGVISGAMIPLKDKFNLSKEMQEMVVSITLGGAILASLLTSYISERFGRRIVMLIASSVFTAGAIIMGVASTTTELLIGRFVVGMGIGFASTTVPLYIAEAAPAHIRGQLVTVNQLFITFGQFAASAINGAFSYMDDGWRYMLGVAAIPSFILFVGFIFMPESPRWLISKGHLEKARKVLVSLRGQENNEEEISHIEEHNAKASQGDDSGNSLKRVFTTKATRRALILGCGLQAFQQLSGINTVMYYSGTIIQMAGVQSQTTIIWLTAAVAGGNFVFTLFSMMVVERFGRRKLTLCSIFGVCVALCLLGVTFIVLKDESIKTMYNLMPSQKCSTLDSCYTCVEDSNCGFCYVQSGGNLSNGSCLSIDKQFDKDRSPFCNASTYVAASKGQVEWAKVCPTSYAWLAVISMVFYLAMFAPGLGPMPWAINAEIYPLWARSIGTAASTATNWTLNLLVSLTFLNLLEAITRPGAFFFYAGITFCGFIFLFVLQPETKGKKLEEVEELFDGPVCIPCGGK